MPARETSVAGTSWSNRAMGSAPGGAVLERRTRLVASSMRSLTGALLPKQHLNGKCGHFRQGLMHRGERWRNPLRHRDVVEAYDAEIVRHPQAVQPGGLIHSNGVDVAGRENRGWRIWKLQHRSTQP